MDLELGYLLMGCPRGTFTVDRQSRVGRKFMRMLQDCGFDNRGFPRDDAAGERVKSRMQPASIAHGLENDVFVLRSYDWNADCDCGYEATLDELSARFPHTAECYQTRLRSIKESIALSFGVKEIWQVGDAAGMAALSSRSADASYKHCLDLIAASNLAQGLIRSGNPLHSELYWNAHRSACEQARAMEDAATQALCTEMGLSYPNGSAVHCSCENEVQLTAFCKTQKHKDNCRLIQPNFLHKASGYALSWYKYPLRSAAANMQVSRRQFQAIAQSCVASVS